MGEDYWAKKEKEIARQNKIRDIRKEMERIRNKKTLAEKLEIERCEIMREIYAGIEKSKSKTTY